MPAELKAPPAIARIPVLREYLACVRKQGRTIGLVPTMGALHAGHGALMDRARSECGCVVVSIFVNPLQFERRDDLDAYTIELPADLEFCGAHGVDVVFAPAPEEMYIPGRSTFVEVTGLSDHLCGPFRPGHFRGVATVVTKLLNIVAPERAYFGEKDAQQLAIIRRLAADLNIPVEIVAVPTVREPDGLALSSRNRRLTPVERRIAPALYRALEAGRESIARGCASGPAVRETVTGRMRGEPEIRVEYVEVVDAESMQPVERILAPVRIAAAVWLGNTRLIDNVYSLPPAHSSTT